jgi:protoheme IX farnesyltransferase
MITGYISLTKPRIIILLLVTALGGLFLASAGLPDPSITMAVLVGGSLAAGGANAINHFLDRDIDEKMRRTRNRPIVSGIIRPQFALSFGILLNIIAFSILVQWANILSALLTLFATLFYVFVYTMGLKRSTSQNIVIGGAAGAIPPMVGWAAITGNIMDTTPLFLFTLIFLWTPPHFWALSLILKDDYAEAGIPMMPVTSGVAATKRQIFIYTWLLLALLPSAYFLTDSFSEIFWVPAFLLTTVFIFFAWRLLKSQGIESAKPTYIFSLAYLGLMFIASMVDSGVNI